MHSYLPPIFFICFQIVVDNAIISCRMRVLSEKWTKAVNSRKAVNHCDDLFFKKRERSNKCGHLRRVSDLTIPEINED